MTDIWPLIQIMFEQHELVHRARQEIDKIREKLGERPTEATEIINFLNSKTKEEIEALEIEDKT
jgi:DNA-directed RNA polymerase specialized sigma subunit